MADKRHDCIGSAAVKESWTYSISIKSPPGTVKPEETVSLLINGLPHDMRAKEKETFLAVGNIAASMSQGDSCITMGMGDADSELLKDYHQAFLPCKDLLGQI